MIHWQKSSYSDSRGQCVELARLATDTAGVRDSTTPHGPHHTFNVGTLRELITKIKEGRHEVH